MNVAQERFLLWLIPRVFAQEERFPEEGNEVRKRPAHLLAVKKSCPSAASEKKDIRYPPRKRKSSTKGRRRRSRPQVATSADADGEKGRFPLQRKGMRWKKRETTQRRSEEKRKKFAPTEREILRRAKRRRVRWRASWLVGTGLSVSCREKVNVYATSERERVFVLQDEQSCETGLRFKERRCAEGCERIPV